MSCLSVLLEEPAIAAPKRNRVNKEINV
ncbi:MAG: translation initiation factor IF-3, partial [Gammaproteobacteria bacterium]|nr:translation initiation factor IF-3 [Gammaproteobacteria bacterium]